jgi:hypothetical protein
VTTVRTDRAIALLARFAARVEGFQVKIIPRREQKDADDATLLEIRQFLQARQAPADLLKALVEIGAADLLAEVDEDGPDAASDQELAEVVSGQLTLWAMNALPPHLYERLDALDVRFAPRPLHPLPAVDDVIGLVATVPWDAQRLRRCLVELFGELAELSRRHACPEELPDDACQFAGAERAPTQAKGQAKSAAALIVRLRDGSVFRLTVQRHRS